MSGVESKGGVKINGRSILPAVDLDPKVFEAALADKGYNVTWERAAHCPNRPPGISPRAHPLNCKHCDGDGFIYWKSCDTEMLITSVNIRDAYYQQGSWDNGQVYVTSKAAYHINQRDRLILQNGLGVFMEVLRRQPGQDFDKPKYVPIDVEYLGWIDRSGSILVFQPGVDFDFSGGIITWGGGDRPDQDTDYTIVYTYRPRYIVTDLLHQHRDSTVGGTHKEFPVQGMAKLEYLMRDESKDEPETLFDNPLVSR